MTLLTVAVAGIMVLSGVTVFLALRGLLAGSIEHGRYPGLSRRDVT